MFKHKDCRNFNQMENWCMVKDKSVNPDEPACDDKFIPIHGI